MTAVVAVAGEAPRTTEEGDQERVVALWREHRDALLSHVRRRVSDPVQAEDIVQEVMLRAWRHVHRLEAATRPLRPWLFTVADHVVIDQHRSRRARPPEVGSQALHGLSAPDAVDHALRALDMLEALRQLSPEHRLVLVETYYRGRTVAEVSAMLGIPTGTVKSRAYYALRALRLHLEERGWTS